MVTYIQWGQGVRTWATLRGVRNPKAKGDEDQEVGFITVIPLTLILPVFRWCPKPVHKESRTNFPEDSRHSIPSKQEGKGKSAIEIDSLTWLPQEWRNSSLTEAQMAAFKPKGQQGAMRSVRWYILYYRDYSDDYFIKCFLWKKYRRFLLMPFYIYNWKDSESSEQKHDWIT